MRRGKAWVLLLLALVILAVCGCNTGTEVNEPPEPTAPAPETPVTGDLAPLPELPAARWSGELASADLVVLGTVTALKDSILASGTQAFTTANFTVEQVLKGDPSIKEVTFRAEIDLPAPLASGEGAFWPYAVADRLLISLHRGPGGIYTMGEIYWGESPKVEITAASYYAGDYEYTIDGLENWLGLVVRVMQDNGIPVAMKNPPSFNPERQPLD